LGQHQGNTARQFTAPLNYRRTPLPANRTMTASVLAETANRVRRAWSLWHVFPAQSLQWAPMPWPRISAGPLSRILCRRDLPRGLKPESYVTKLASDAAFAAALNANSERNDVKDIQPIARLLSLFSRFEIAGLDILQARAFQGPVIYTTGGLRGTARDELYFRHLSQIFLELL